MRVFETEAMELCNSMREAIATGHTWMAYSSGEFFEAHNKPIFFKSEEEAQDFCISNYSDYDQYTGRKILPTLSALQTKINESSDRQDIAYYFIIGNEVTIALKANPDQNGLYNSEGNAFTTAWIDEIDKSRTKEGLQQKGKEIERQLSELSIVELYDLSGRQQLLRSLESGKKELVTFSKSLVPAEHIESFVVLEHKYPDSLVHQYEEKGHTFTEINSFAEFDPAWSEMHRRAYNLANDSSKYNVEIMLVGRYDGKHLEFDFQGTPEINTGYLLATACSVTKPGQRPDYEVHVSEDPTRITIVKETLYAQFNAASNSVEFSDIIKGNKQIDINFWKRDPVELYFAQENDPSTEIPTNQIVSPHFKNTIMNQDNLDYLKNSLLYMGFGDRLHADLEKNIRDGKQEFVLHDSHEFYNGNRRMESVLYFNKGKENEMYFWNKYEGKLIKPDSSSESQTFYINQVKVENKESAKMETKLSGYTLKEAVNLLDGRFTEKEFINQQNQPYTSWKGINFEARDKHGNYEYKTFHENYGYNVVAALEKVPLKDLERNSAKEDLIRSLKKGNLQVATAENGERVYLSANPQYKSINVFDKDMKPVKDLSKLQAIGQEKGQTASNSNNPTVNEMDQQTSARDNTAKNEKESEKNNKEISPANDDLLQKTGKKKATGKHKNNPDNGEGDLIPKKHRRTKSGQHL